MAIGPDGTNRDLAVMVLSLAAQRDPHALDRAVELAAAVARGEPERRPAVRVSPVLKLLRSVSR